MRGILVMITAGAGLFLWPTEVPQTPGGIENRERVAEETLSAVAVSPLLPQICSAGVALTPVAG